MRRTILTIMTLAVAVLSAGCIKESLEDCYNLSLTFSYTGDGEDEKFSEAIEKVDLYVFDSGTSELVKTLTYGQDDLKGNTAPDFRLDPGNYVVVAIANNFDRTDVHISEDGDWSKSYFQHPELGRAGGCVDGHDHNYLGYMEVKMASHKVLKDTLEFKSSHMDVAIDVKGLGEGIQINSGTKSGAYQIYFEQSNGRTDFKNEVIEEATGICEPVFRYDAEKGYAVSDNLVLFRADCKCDHILKVISPEGVELVSMDIEKYVSEHPEIDITKQEALLPIEVMFTAVGVEVTVPDWYIVDTKPEF